MDAIVGLISTLFTLVVFAAIVLAIVAVWSYNSLRKLAENVRKREMAHQYREGEKLVMLKVSQDNSETAMRDAYHRSGTMLAAIQGMAQRFPELKATEQFRELLPAIDRTSRVRRRQ